MSTTLSPGDLLTRQQAAELLGLKVQTLALWASTGRVKLPFVRVGNRAVRYKRSDIEKLISQGTVGGAA